LLVGGSEDGLVYIWDQESGDILQKLQGHEAMVYNAVWSPKQSMFVSSSDDRTVRTWYYDGKHFVHPMIVSLFMAWYALHIAPDRWLTITILS
jgi:WD40 repeat protein